MIRGKYEAYSRHPRKQMLVFPKAIDDSIPARR